MFKILSLQAAKKADRKIRLIAQIMPHEYYIMLYRILYNIYNTIQYIEYYIIYIILYNI